MNRSRLIYRSEAEGDQGAQAAALALAQIADRELILSLTHHISALREFGGELYIGAARTKIDREHVTHAYVVGYTEKSRIRTNPPEADESHVGVEVPAPEYDEIELPDHGLAPFQG